jgi:hypothetical protein
MPLVGLCTVGLATTKLQQGIGIPQSYLTILLYRPNMYAFIGSLLINWKISYLNTKNRASIIILIKLEQRPYSFILRL